MFEEDDKALDETVKKEKPKKKVSKPKEDLGIKYYTVELPSKGLLGYPAELEYRDILVRDEKILSAATSTTFQSIINKVLKSLLKEEEVFDELTIADRDYLMLWIWANNYTTTKEFDVTCEHCTNVDNLVIDVTKTDITELSDEYENPYEYVLSNDHSVYLKLLTTKDEQIATEFVKKNKNNSLESVLMALSIDVGKVLMLPQKLKWIEDNINGHDMGMIRGFQEYFSYGIDDEVEHACESCGEVTKHSIPFSLEFFMPTLRNDFEKMFRTNKRSKHKST